MHLILDFQDGVFSLEEKEVKEPALHLSDFFKFKQKEDFLLEELVKLGISNIKNLINLVERGYITQEAKEKIKELLAKSSREAKCI
jgi:nucleotidyltransferase/DNA polymerase involved in DNA repair